MSLSIYSKASTDLLLGAKASLSGATFTGTVTAPNFTITAGSGGVLTFSDGTTMSTASGGGGGAVWGSITGSITDQTDLQTEFGNYLPLAGGTMTGSLSLSVGGIYSTNIGIGSLNVGDSTNTTTLTPSYLSSSNSSVTSYFTPGYIQFADGSTQTTAASGGMDYFAACYAGITSALAINFVSFDGVNQWTFNWGSGAQTSNVFNGSIGVTQDGSTFYAFDTVPSAGVFGASGFTFDSGNNVYLAYKDSTGAWHFNPSGVLYTP